MKRARIVILFLLLLIIELGLVLPLFSGSRRFPSVILYINETPTGYEVRTEQEMESHWADEDLPEYTTTVFLRTRTGPFWPLFEWEVMRSFELAPNLIYPLTPDTHLTSADDSDAIIAAVYDYALRDPEMARYAPGRDHVTTFSFGGLISTIVLWIVLSLLPAVLMCLFLVLPKIIREQIMVSRANKGLCVHCKYDCSGLDTTTCPECGQTHQRGTNREWQ